MLEDWNCRSDMKSVPMTVFTFWFQRIFSAGKGDPDYQKYNIPEGLIMALEDALDELTQTFGTWEIEWGEINRLQRIDTLSDQNFDDALPSLPAIGGWATAGVLFAFYAPPSAGNRRRYGTFGSSFIYVVELGKAIKSFSIVPFGQSSDSRSPHYFDQAPLYAAGRLKPCFFEHREIERISEKTYQP
jgi:acyl-homoserine-lactone acylase